MPESRDCCGLRTTVVVLLQSTIKDLPPSYRKIQHFFNKLKSLYSYNQKQELVLFNNNGKPIFLWEWFKKVILSISDLLNEGCNFLTFYEFHDKHSCESNFLQYYQVVSTIAKHLRSLAQCSDIINKSFLLEIYVFPQGIDTN